MDNVIFCQNLHCDGGYQKVASKYRKWWWELWELWEPDTDYTQSLQKKHAEK